VAQAEASDPQAAYWNLETAELLQAKTLDEAGHVMLRRLADLIPG
jgi:hypothetical protein